jgi:preprotein translocase subunit SecA
MRKTLLEYDNVINEQREIIYDRRNEILDSDSIHERVIDTIKNFVTDTVNEHTVDGYLSEDDRHEIVEYFNEFLPKKIKDADVKEITEEELDDLIYDKLLKSYNDKIKELPKEVIDSFEKAITLRVIDTYWMEHINTMSHLREGISLRGYAQENPLRSYQIEGYELFEQLLIKIDRQSSIYLLKAEIRQNLERKKVAEGVANQDTSKTTKSTPKRVNKIGRNDPCPCGSGKKYKQCCGK